MSRLGIAIAAVLCVVATGAGLLVDVPDVAAALGRATDALGPWTYAIVGLLVVLETTAVLGVVSPGESALAVAGAAAAHGAVELPLLIAAAWSAGVLGDATGYGLGRRYGRTLLLGCGPHIGLSHHRLERLEGMTRRWGGAALVVGRFVGVLRAFTPFLAGASALGLRRLAGFSLAGAGAWCSASILGGYAFASSLGNHLDAVGNGGLGLAGGALLAWALRGSIARPGSMPDRAGAFPPSVFMLSHGQGGRSSRRPRRGARRA